MHEKKLRVIQYLPSRLPHLHNDLVSSRLAFPVEIFQLQSEAKLDRLVLNATTGKRVKTGVLAAPPPHELSSSVGIRGIPRVQEWLLIRYVLLEESNHWMRAPAKHGESEDIFGAKIDSLRLRKETLPPDHPSRTLAGPLSRS